VYCKYSIIIIIIMLPNQAIASTMALLMQVFNVTSHTMQVCHLRRRTKQPLQQQQI
jgi:hypothetical protein